MSNYQTCACGHTSDNEHDPCDCDDDCCTHAKTITSLRSDLQRVTAERDAFGRGQDALQKRLAEIGAQYDGLLRRHGRLRLVVVAGDEHAEERSDNQDHDHTHRDEMHTTS